MTSLNILSDDVICLLKMTKTFSTTAEKRDQPELLRTIYLAVTLHSGTAAPLDIFNSLRSEANDAMKCTVRFEVVAQVVQSCCGPMRWRWLSGSSHVRNWCSVCMTA